MKQLLAILLIGMSFSSIADYFPPNGDNIFERPEPVKPLTAEQEFSIEIAKAITFTENYCSDGSSVSISSILASDKNLEIIEVIYPDYSDRYLTMVFNLSDGSQYSYACPRN